MEGRAKKAPRTHAGVRPAQAAPLVKLARQEAPRACWGPQKRCLMATVPKKVGRNVCQSERSQYRESWKDGAYFKRHLLNIPRRLTRALLHWQADAARRAGAGTSEGGRAVSLRQRTLELVKTRRSGLDRKTAMRVRPRSSWWRLIPLCACRRTCEELRERKPSRADTRFTNSMHFGPSSSFSLPTRRRRFTGHGCALPTHAAGRSDLRASPSRSRHPAAP